MTAESGVHFPTVNGARSSTAVGREALAVAAQPVDDALARRIRATDNWRKGYLRPARDLVALSGRSSEQAVAAARAGVAYLSETFVDVRDGVERPLPAVFDTGGALVNRSVVGGGARGAGLSVPYRGHDLEGSDLRRQLRRWQDAGIAEPSFRAAIEAVIDHPEWLDLRQVHVVLLGAGAELGPLRHLLRWGATVSAVDLPRPDLQRRIIAAVAGTPGVLHLPVPAGAALPSAPTADQLAAVAGADLLTQLGDIAAWLDRFDDELVLGNYLYGDGAVNVRLSVAGDALGQHLIATHRRPTTLAFLATPTDAFDVGADIVDDARDRWSRAWLARFTRRPLRLANLFQPNYPDVLTDDHGRRYAVADCLVPQQGPNYLLAKRMQRWRAIQARAAGVRVSINVAPATRTYSVVKNRALAAAYAGAGRFGVEVFDPATTNALMAALLVRDLRDPSSAANPDVTLAHPSMLFTEAANHGGLWRSAFSPRSVLGVAAMIGVIDRGA